jgi:UDP-4-amino-4,6-dideoxy-L-N-acetyl-beta-L-altrosamine transaminase
VGTVAAALNSGATIVFADIDLDNGNVNLEQVSESTKNPISRGRNILFPVHYAGIPVDTQLMERSIKNPDTMVIEDAAHALGSTYYDGKKVGSCNFSDMTVFSFHPAKTITTGEGGMVTTNSESLYNRLLLFRNNGIMKEFKEGAESPGPWHYEVHDLTGNYNFTDFQAALGLSQFKKLDQFVHSRRHLISRYRQKLSQLPHVLMTPEKYDSQTAYHLCSVKIDFEACGISRAELMAELARKGIGTQVHYIPVYRHPYFVKSMGELEGHFPQMEEFFSKELSLPLFPDLKEKELDRVCETLASLLGGRKVMQKSK